MLEIDGAMGEGGGQVLRTSLALSAITGTPLRVVNVRAGRKRPGLRRQHCAAIEAAAQVADARVEGVALDSRAFSFVPRAIRGGAFRFEVDTAGSMTLVAQTVLPALWAARTPATLSFRGGTHNPMAPTFHYLAEVFLPQVAPLGCHVEATLERPGFYPKGGGRFRLELAPERPAGTLELIERPPLTRARARVLAPGLPEHVAQRELARVRERLGWSEDQCEVVACPPRHGPGNALILDLEFGDGALREQVTAFGEKTRRAESVADEAADEAARYLDAGVPVGEHLADQLLLPLALAGGGRFRALPLSLHAETQLELIPRFLDVRFAVSPCPGGVEVEVRRV
ncbi:MAG: RNA 3'-terminal phosphate cyclase [Planctomycetota bacterium]